MANGIPRYSLVVKDLSTDNQFLIKFKERGSEDYKEKAFLTTIDKRTTDFENEKQLLQYLKQKGYINFTKAEVYITYQSKGKTKTLNVIYENQTDLKYFAKKYTTYIALDDGKFRYIFDEKFMKEIRRGSFYDFMISYNYINKRLKFLLEEYLYDGREFRREDIMKEMSRYKNLRDYFLGKQHFEKHLQSREKKEISNIKYEDRKLHISSDDEFLNSLDDPDEVTRYYDLDDLERMEIDGNPLFDGLGKIKKIGQ